MNRTAIRTITSLLTFCLLLSTFPVSAVRAQREYRVTPPALARTAATPLALTSTSAFAAFPMDESVMVDLAIDEDSVKCLWGREVTEQIRDWLLFTVVSSSDLTPAEVNQVFYDLPASRCGYLEGVANFEYGNTRSRFIGNGQIVALLPPGDGNARIDQLGRIADEHRKNLGELPSAITVFEYNIDQSSQTARLTKQGVVNAQQLFSEQYGYYSSTVNNLPDLERFMKQIDDLTYASFESTGLVLGGRKIRNRTYQGIRVEDVAAIWKSEESINANFKKFETYARSIEKEFNDAWTTFDNILRDFSTGNISGMSAGQVKLKRMRDAALLNRQVDAPGAEQTPRPSPAISAYDGLQNIFSAIEKLDLAAVKAERKRADKIRDEQEVELKALLVKEAKARRLVGASGFSLDPTYDFEGLSKFFAEELAPLLGEIAAISPTEISQREITEAKTALTKKDANPFLRLLGKLSKAGDPRLAQLIHWETRLEYAFQHARYNGQLKGTEVGMVLFYTDLLAKLWALDFMNSTPSDRIRGFYPLSEAPVSAVHKVNVGNFSRTRLWFGPRNQGFQLAGENGNKMLFGPTAARVYSASSDPFAPGEETQGNASSTEFLGWWDQHYDEIARYEPQYERLNEIMKWSVVVGWLSNSDRLSSMNFLKDVAVNDSNRFPEWVSRNPTLKFQDWQKIGFHPPGYKNSLTEALPVLTSPTGDLMGGVTLAGKSVFRNRKPLTPNEKINARTLRSNVDYSATTASPAGESIKWIDGSTFGLKNGPVTELIAKAKEKTYLRDSASELGRGLSFRRKLTKTAQNLKVETSAGQVPIGELRITKRPNGFEVGTESRALEAGHSFGRDLSLVDDPEVMIKSHPDVQTAYKTSGTEYVVKLRGQNKWHLFSLDDGAKPLPVGWDSRIAEIGGERVVNIKTLDSAGPQATPARLLRSDRLPVAGEPIPRTEFGRLDTLIADSPVKALRQVDELIATHGATPELSLRRAVAQIRRGKTVEGERGLADFVKAAGDKANDIIEDMNALLTANGRMPKGDGLFVITDADQVGWGYRVAEFRTAPGGVDPTKDYVYLDLNLVDQNQSTLDTMQQVLANGLGESVEVPTGSIGTYRPAYIREGGPPGAPNAGRTFKIVTKSGIPPPRIRPMIPCVDTDDDEMQDDGDFICGEDEDRDRPIYLVISKSK